jgi:plastocyanin
LRRRRIAVLFAATIAAIVAAATAMAQSATITWQESFNSKAPENNPTINTGETVTWNVAEGGHNVDVTGPESFKSTSGEDKKGTQFVHTFTRPGTYTYVCDYHDGMHGTITVVDAAPPSAPPAAVDAAPPTLQRVSLHRGTLRVRLSEASKLTVRIRRRGSHRVARHRLHGHAGINRIRLVRWLRPGRYSVSVVATDAAGNRSRALRLSVRR